MKATLKNTQTSETKIVKVGFSWTTFFFGFWLALLRGDWLWSLIIFGIECLSLWILFIPHIILSFVYNQIYIKKLIEKGFHPADELSKVALAAKKILVDTATETVSFIFLIFYLIYPSSFSFHATIASMEVKEALYESSKTIILSIRRKLCIAYGSFLRLCG